jgi:hypothetical protein
MVLDTILFTRLFAKKLRVLTTSPHWQIFGCVQKPIFFKDFHFSGFSRAEMGSGL